MLRNETNYLENQLINPFQYYPSLTWPVYHSDQFNRKLICMNTFSTGILLLSVLTFNLYGSDLRITNVRVLDRADIADNPLSVLFDVQWGNAWNNDKNHDGVWVFMKFNAHQR